MNNAQPCGVDNRNDVNCEQSKCDVKVVPCPQFTLEVAIAIVKCGAGVLRGMVENRSLSFNTYWHARLVSMPVAFNSHGVRAVASLQF
jgi:hypothetical protein